MVFVTSTIKLAINRDERSTIFSLTNLSRVSMYSLLFWNTPLIENFLSSMCLAKVVVVSDDYEETIRTARCS